MKRTASERISDLSYRLERIASLLSPRFENDPQHVEDFKARLKNLIALLQTEKPHSLAKELQNIIDTYGREESPKRNELIRISILHTLRLGSSRGLKTTRSSKIGPGNFKKDNLPDTTKLLVDLLNYRLINK